MTCNKHMKRMMTENTSHQGLRSLQRRPSSHLMVLGRSKECLLGKSDSLAVEDTEEDQGRGLRLVGEGYRTSPLLGATLPSASCKFDPGPLIGEEPRLVPEGRRNFASAIAPTITPLERVLMLKMRVQVGAASGEAGCSRKAMATSSALACICPSRASSCRPTCVLSCPPLRFEQLKCDGG